MHREQRPQARLDRPPAQKADLHYFGVPCPWLIVPSQPILTYIFSMLYPKVAQSLRALSTRRSPGAGLLRGRARLGPPDTDQQFISSNPKSVYNKVTGQGYLPNLGRSSPIFFFHIERINLAGTPVPIESSCKQPCCRHPDIDIELVVNPFDKYIPWGSVRLPNA